jgi:hypothetical protein
MRNSYDFLEYPKAPAAYHITYNVADASGNPAVEVIRTVTVEWPEGLSLYLDILYAEVECGDVFEAPVARVRNACGDFFDEALASGEVDATAPGQYTLTYTYEDAPELSLIVVVEDSLAPEITLLGDAAMLIECGEAFADPGAFAMDHCDSDLTAAIITFNPVDTDMPGTYYVAYDVMDAAGNRAPTEARTVIVLDNCPYEGEGEVPGEGETPAEGEGEAPAEGEGEAPAEGEGEAPAEGEGEAPPSITVPDVMGMKLDEARALLEALGFQVRVEYITHVGCGNLADDTVLEQNPEAGTLAYHAAEITLTVAESRQGCPGGGCAGSADNWLQHLILALLALLGLWFMPAYGMVVKRNRTAKTITEHKQ